MTDRPPAPASEHGHPGLVWAYDIPVEGMPTELPSDGAWPAPPTEGYRWVHFDRTHEHGIEWLQKESGLSALTAEVLLADETRPRATLMEEGILVVLRGMNLNPGAEPEDMVAPRFLVQPHRVVSVRRRKVLAIQDLRDEVAHGRQAQSPALWLAQLIERLLDRMREPLDELDDEFDQLELASLETPASVLRRQLGEARRTAVTLRRYLSPQRDAITRLAQDPLFEFDETVRMRLRESADRMSRYLEDLEANRDRASVTQEELSARLAESMNQTSYRLTLVAAIFLPLGFFTGLFGINVGGMPLVDSPYGFWGVTIAMILITMGQVWYFKRQKWW